MQELDICTVHRILLKVWPCVLSTIDLLVLVLESIQPFKKSSEYASVCVYKTCVYKPYSIRYNISLRAMHVYYNLKSNSHAIITFPIINVCMI